ncbi:bidirectional sugar transporter SWEET14-like isoform X1 [Castanea sativa]|uniref:bidirectional sugar transporter SWEET14-like isoform X1 n=1 Tax=Castanea sativa TaxID=21020 RepID=UPI003F651ED7
MATIHAVHLAFVFGLLGNVVSFLVYLAPLPTFSRICKKKSTEGFQSLPYSVALFSAMLTLYYGYLKNRAIMLITINSIGCAIESIYLIIFMIYAPGRARIYTAKLLAFFNLGLFGMIVLCTSLLIKQSYLRLTVVGWMCAIFSVSVFAAPLSIMTPNILGFIFGIAQMILYIIYKDKKNVVLPEFKVEDAPNGTITSIQLSTTETPGKLNAMNQTQESKIVKGIGDAPTEAIELNV